ncbi:hypothetical protein ANCCAN_04940 [Ancylostoma caninum]|uniref:Uncharacterized protein n=1 Tax=Ancylostoma caninum TaxID=29170 RepID=A0A368GZJ3_ANCCA|nr:hypothetical protein ANCCAN_04940 [Ancylostoma caninum]
MNAPKFENVCRKTVKRHVGTARTPQSGHPNAENLRTAEIGSLTGFARIRSTMKATGRNTAANRVVCVSRETPARFPMNHEPFMSNDLTAFV